MYKICYVLTDNSELKYFKQMVISASSLRKHGYDGKICVLIDNETESIINKSGFEYLQKLDVDTVSINVPEEYSAKEKSRYIKTSMRNLIDGDFLFVDTDTVIADKLPAVISNDELAMVRDYHCEINCRGDLLSLEALHQKCGYTLRKNDNYFNSGVIWAKDTPTVRSFFSKWHQYWNACRKNGIQVDQPSLNYLNGQTNVICLLEDKYNVQISSAPYPINHLHNAIILHYYNVASANHIYPLQNQNIFKKNIFDSEIQKIISFPAEVFLPNIICQYNQDFHTKEYLLATSSFITLKKMYANHYFLFRVINYLLKLVGFVFK